MSAEDIANALDWAERSEHEKEVARAYRRGSRDTLVFIAVLFGLGLFVWIVDTMCGTDPTI
jgi:hypothetical protein